MLKSLIMDSCISQLQQAPLRAVLSTQGTFHFFDLARELETRNALLQIYSTYHWGRLKRESLSRDKVSCFPVVHPALMLMGRYNIHLPRPLNWQANRMNAVLFDRWVAAHLPECDVFSALSSSGLLSGKAAKRRGIPYICDRGSSHIRYQDRLLAEEYSRWGCKQTACDPFIMDREEEEYATADAIAVPSEFVRRSFIEMGTDPAKLHKIPYGVNLQRFAPDAEPDPTRFEIVFAGQVGFRKGLPYLLDAFKRLRHPGKRLRIAGAVQPEMQRYLEHNLPEGVEILGSIPQPALRHIFSTSHVLVLPSLEEGLALVQGQAMACGCAIISSTNTGGSDLFRVGIDGFEIPIRSADAILERLEELADCPELLLKMRSSALERVKQLGGWKEYGDSYLAMMRELTTR